MSRYLVKFDELKYKSQTMKKILKQIEESIENIEKSKSILEWESPSKDKFIIVYDNYLLNLRKLRDTLLVILMLTNSFYNNYNETYKKIKQEFKKLHEELIERCQKEKLNVE